MKPKIAVVYDSEGWSFHNIAKQIAIYLSDEFDVLPTCHHKLDYDFLLEADVSICLWYGSTANLSLVKCKKIACCFDEILRWDPKNGWANEETILAAIDSADIFLCSSDGMARRMFPYFPSPRKFGRCKDGVDLDLFPLSPYRTLSLMPDGPTDDPLDKSTPLRVGWVGNTEVFGDLKGVSLIKEACDGLEGVKLFTQDRKSHGLIPHDEMHKFYQMIDVYVCASTIEGTPNPILEASACGRAWVSTDVGIVPELVADAHDLHCGAPPGIIVPRQVSAIRECLKKMRDNRSMLPIMGKVGRYTIEQRWTWKRMAEQYRDAIHSIGIWGDMDLSKAVHRIPRKIAQPKAHAEIREEVALAAYLSKRPVISIQDSDPVEATASVMLLLKENRVPVTMKVIVSMRNFFRIPEYIELAEEHDCDCFFLETLPNGNLDRFFETALLYDKAELTIWLDEYRAHPSAHRVKQWPEIVRRADVEILARRAQS